MGKESKRMKIFNMKVNSEEVNDTEEVVLKTGALGLSMKGSGGMENTTDPGFKKL